MHSYIITYEENNVLKTITICAKDEAAAIGTFYSLDGFENANIHSITTGYSVPIPTKETERKNVPHENSEFRESLSVGEAVFISAFLILSVLALLLLVSNCSVN